MLGGENILVANLQVAKTYIVSSETSFRESVWGGKLHRWQTCYPWTKLTFLKHLNISVASKATAGGTIMILEWTPNVYIHKC